MNKGTLKFLIGSMLMLVTGYEQPKGATKHNCRVYKEHDLLIADCSNNKTSIVVPDNLEPNIKVLDISHNRFTLLTSDSFKRYPLLLRLIMTYVISMDSTAQQTYPVAIDKDIFVPLIQLEHLNMSYSWYHGSLIKMIWPPSLQELILDGIKLEDNLNLQNLSRLVRFSASKNALTSLPRFSSNLPTLKYINLRDNPIEKLKIEQIAHFCALESLQINSNEASFELTTEPLYCECQRVKKWFSDYEISGFDVSCFKHDTKPPKCDLTFDQESLSTRQQCPKKHKSIFTRVKKYAFPIGIVFATLLILFISFLLYEVNAHGHTESDSNDIPAAEFTEDVDTNEDEESLEDDEEQE